jgi:hypothetical protein
MPRPTHPAVYGRSPFPSTGWGRSRGTHRTLVYLILLADVHAVRRLPPTWLVLLTTAQRLVNLEWRVTRWQYCVGPRGFGNFPLGCSRRAGGDDSRRTGLPVSDLTCLREFWASLSLGEHRSSPRTRRPAEERTCSVIWEDRQSERRDGSRYTLVEEKVRQPWLLHSDS